MSTFQSGNPNTGAFRSYTPGPHSGLDPDATAQVAPDSIEARARTALTLGLMSLLLGFVTGIPAIWFGRKALAHIDAAEGDLQGRWAAWSGIVLGSVGVLGTFAVWFYLHQRS